MKPDFNYLGVEMKKTKLRNIIRQVIKGEKPEAIKGKFLY